MAETKKKQYSTAVRIYEYTAAALPKETVRHQASCEEVYKYVYPVSLAANRDNSTVLLYVYTSTPPQQYQYVPKETVRHQASCEEVYTYVYPVSLAARYRGCVPISPVDTTWQDGGMQVRTQLPLRLCWAITMHKS